jgi:cation:H+ antiporter
MNVGLSYLAFALGALVSLGTSWVLVSRLERVGERFGLSEALLGMVAALAADAPEITAAVSSLLQHEQTIGAGVVLGSNVFNLAALLGLGAVVAGGIALHRRVVVFGGAVAVFIATVCVLTVADVIPLALGLVLVLVVLTAYGIVLGAHRRVLASVPLPPRWTTWLTAAILEEEIELEGAIHPRRGTRGDLVTAIVALVVVVVASVVMERGASTLGRHYGIPEIVVGGIVLAAVTSLPNAVAAVFLARKGRGAAAFSTALNSNNINVAAGLLIPAAFLGLAQSSGSGLLVAGWYLGLTVVALVLAYVGRGLHRWAGWLIMAAYVGFVAVILATT